jgi:hypothetical protein
MVRRLRAFDLKAQAFSLRDVQWTSEKGFPHGDSNGRRFDDSTVARAAAGRHRSETWRRCYSSKTRRHLSNGGEGKSLTAKKATPEDPNRQTRQDKQCPHCDLVKVDCKARRRNPRLQDSQTKLRVDALGTRNRRLKSQRRSSCSCTLLGDSPHVNPSC